MRLIDGDALKAVFEEKSSEAVCGVELCKAVIFRINEAPTIDAVPVKRGHWIEIQAPDMDGNVLYQCSVCHKGETHCPDVEVPFCWHCGSDMRGEQDGGT